MVIPKAAANSEWFFQKIFGDGDFIAAGQLLIPPQVKKPGKGTKDNTYVRGRLCILNLLQLHD
jgi:centromere protein C